LLNKKGALFLSNEWEYLRGEDIHDLVKAVARMQVRTLVGSSAV
jgi:hypothetical protein